MIVSKTEAAEFLGVDRRAIDRYIRAGCPVLEQGSRNTPWRLDLLAVVEWFFTARHRYETDPETMAAADRKAWYTSEGIRLALDEKMRGLIPADEVELAVASAYIEIRDSSRLIPELAAKRIDLSPEHRADLERTIEGYLDALADRLRAMAPCLAAFRGDRDT